MTTRKMIGPAVLALALGLTACTTTNNVQSDFASGDAADDVLANMIDGDRAPTAKSLHAAARISKSQGRTAACEILLNRLLNHYPDYMPAYNDLAQLYVQNNMLDSAIETLRAGLEVSPDDSVLLNNLGMCHLVKRQFASAVENFTEATASQPVDARARANLAVGLALMGRTEEAFALMLQVLPVHDAHNNMAVLFETLGNEQMANMHRALARG